MPRPGARCAEHPRRQLRAEVGDEEAEVAGDTDRNDGDDGGVFQQQISAGHPTGELAEHGMPIGVRRASCGIIPANSAYDGAVQALATPAMRNDTLTAGPAGPVGDRASQGEDDGTDANGGQLPKPQAALEVAVLAVGDDGLAAEDSGLRRGVLELTHVASSPWGSGNRPI
jgi:hypothetical protein